MEEEEISGFLKKLKSGGFGKMLGNTNHRFFQANTISGQFGYRSNLRAKQFKKSYQLKNITDVIDNITPEERKMCDWKFGFKLKMNNNLTTFYAENASEKLKWVNYFEILLGKKAPRSKPINNNQIERSNVNNGAFESKIRSVSQNNFEVKNIQNNYKPSLKELRNQIELNSDDNDDFLNNIQNENGRFDLNFVKVSNFEPQEIIRPEKTKTPQFNFKAEASEYQEFEAIGKSKNNHIKEDKDIINKTPEIKLIKESEDKNEINFEITENKKPLIMKAKVTSEVKDFEEVNSNERYKLNNNALDESNSKVLRKVSEYDVCLKESYHEIKFENSNNYCKNESQKEKEKENKLEIIKMKVLEKNKDGTLLIIDGKLNDLNKNHSNKNVNSFKEFKAEDDIINHAEFQTRYFNEKNKLIERVSELDKLKIIPYKENEKSLTAHELKKQEVKSTTPKEETLKNDIEKHKNSYIFDESIINNPNEFYTNNSKFNENNLNSNKKQNNSSNSIDITERLYINKNINNSIKNDYSCSSFSNDFNHKNMNKSINIGDVDRISINFFNNPNRVKDRDSTSNRVIVNDFNKNENKKKLGKLVYDVENQEFEFKINKKIVEDFSEIKKRLLLEKSKFLEKDVAKYYYN